MLLNKITHCLIITEFFVNCFMFPLRCDFLFNEIPSLCYVGTNIIKITLCWFTYTFQNFDISNLVSLLCSNFSLLWFQSDCSCQFLLFLNVIFTSLLLSLYLIRTYYAWIFMFPILYEIRCLLWYALSMKSLTMVL